MIFDALRRHIAQQQPERLREVVDLSIKNRVRLWRLKNAVDEKSKLYNQSHALRSEESQCRYSQVATTARSVWPRSFRLLGLSAEEWQMNLHVWNDQNDIDLPNGELASVVRSAYRHRFPYRYSCRDAVLRRSVPWRTTHPAKRLSQVKPRRIANPVVDQFSGSRRKNLASPIVWPRPFFGEDDVHDQGQDDDQYQEKQFAFVCHNYLRFKTAGINTAAQFSRKLDACCV
ncbi:MAG: hypothetical protein ACXW6J_18410 [Candidatus Binatia bacterium]